MTDPAKFASEWRANIKAFGVLGIDPAKCREACDIIEQLEREKAAAYNAGVEDAAAVCDERGAMLEVAPDYYVATEQRACEAYLCAASIRALKKGTS